MMQNINLSVYGARAHNLQNIDVSMPHGKLIVITGLSGSGKSSLAFDTIYAEGQRRYMETFSSYARQFIGGLERPDVDKIEGLSPVIAIEQKTTNKNPRSTVGTVTEIYDYLRLLYARIGEAYSYVSGEKMVKYTEEQIIDLILKEYKDKKILILAPMVVGRKGHYRELFEALRKQGYLKVRVDGEITELSFGMYVDRYKTHDIELLVDKLQIVENGKTRLTQAVKTAMKQGKGQILICDEDGENPRHYSRNLMCPTSGISYPEPEPNTFSFNSPYGACPHCNGLGRETFPDKNLIIPDPNLSIFQGGIACLQESTGSEKRENYLGDKWIFSQIEILGKVYGFTLKTPIKDIPEDGLRAILEGEHRMVNMVVEDVGVTRKFDIDFDGLYSFIQRLYEDSSSLNAQKWASQFMNSRVCEHCHGTRLQNIALHFKIDGKNIAELSAMSLDELYEWCRDVEPHLSAWQKKIGHEILKEIGNRIKFLLDVGIGFLSLSREAGSLSGGESQRIRLATQIGSRLTGVLYILDEPSIGLHQKDNDKLIASLKQLRDLGNTVIVVEHDEDMMRAADYIIDIGPGAGVKGGMVMAQGPWEEFLKQKSITTDYLNGKRKIAIPDVRRSGTGKHLVLKGASGHNLKNVDLKIPLGTFSCITGVSGSGKSSLVSQTLKPVLSRYFYRSQAEPLPYLAIEGLEHIDKVIEVDQAPIGRSPRSNPVTYVGVFNEIRQLYASLPDSKIRGYNAGRFSFNVKGGRCEKCGGAGVETIEMNFLPDVYVTCEECNGKRYNKETLEIRYKGKSINDVLDMTIAQAVEFFENIPSICTKLKAVDDVGLGYITLGQPSTTLSGGEAQRIKLATELSKKSTGNTLYILDEPTTGLHFEDIRILLDVLSKLVDAGNTVLVIEHNLDVVKCADYIVDLGPDGGKGGGRIIAQGTPEEICKVKESYTAQYLKPVLKRK
ncbi:MAG: excinuclease ABC subunit UvrA [Bacteroidales bacterium]|nr:excinuclease ABC subunit UvrA [Bacteroidales bacterium]